MKWFVFDREPLTWSRALECLLFSIAASGLALAFTVIAAQAHDHRMANADWYKSQTINPEARQRMQLGYKSCCDAGDHFQTRFRLVNDGSKYGVETYEYWTGDAWKVVPQDIIQRKKTPDGKPVLFIIKSSGKEVCLIIDEEGI
jgi:hypothetical protein